MLHGHSVARKETMKELRQSQGVCETTGTERFVALGCQCRTYPANLGPCDRHEEGSNGQCVYCDHRLDCHPYESPYSPHGWVLHISPWRIWRWMLSSGYHDSRAGIFRNPPHLLPGRWGFYVLGFEFGSRNSATRFGTWLYKSGLWPW